MEEYLAHLSGRKTQGLIEHCLGVAAKAVKNAERIGGSGFSRTVERCARAHDLGKVQKEFQTFMECPEDARRYNRHARISAMIMREFCSKLDPYVEFHVDSHHGGLSDYSDYERDICKSIDVVNGVSGIHVGAREVDVDAYREARDYYASNREQLMDGLDSQGSVVSYENEALGIRMAHSVLISADWSATSHWDDPYRHKKFSGEHFDSIEDLAENSRKAYQKEVAGAPASRINELRGQYAIEALAKVELEPGIYSLDMPTGSGKTLTSARFAIEHAAVNECDRVFYLAPFIAIAEQNVKVMERLFGKKNVVESHSNVDRSELKQALIDEYGDEAWERFYYEQSIGASRSWGAPIILSTLVSFFETLFSSRNSRLVRVSNVANSVIIIDEFHTLPARLAKPVYRCIQSLVDEWGCSLVLCSATNPSESIVSSQMVEQITPLVNESRKREPEFSRVHTSVANAEREWSQIAKEVVKYKQCLTVCNLKAGCRTLISHIRSLCSDSEVFHISSDLTRECSSRIIRQVKDRLASGKPTKVVATTTISAGVDIDFPVAFVQMSPIDSILQALGRCNREGNLESGQAYIFRATEHRIMADVTWRNERRETERLISEHGFGPGLIEKFYAYKYRSQHNGTNNRLDKHGIIEMERQLAFASVDEAFKMIDSEAMQIPVLERCDPQLVHRYKTHDRLSASDRRRLRRKSVPVWPNQTETYVESGDIERCPAGRMGWVGHYDEKYGKLFA